MRVQNVVIILLAGGTCVGAFAKEVPVAQDPKAAAVIRELGLVESAPALREARGWKTPQKIVLLQMGPPEALRAAAPGVRFVVVDNSAEMAREVADADAVGGVDNIVCDDAVLAAAKKLRWIAVYSAGVEACLGKPAIEKSGIVVTNMRAIAGPVMAEHTIALMMALSRGLQVYIPRQGHWDERSRGVTMESLDGKTMLIAGLGGIGLEVARRAHALGMKVIATRNSSRDKPEYVGYVGLPDELPTLIGQADVVVSALPLVPATTNLFDARMFARMKKNAFFINVGRGGSVVTDDLLAALNAGTIAGAGLDVTEPEPLPDDHPLWKAKNVIITPHVSAQSDLGQGVRALIYREQVRRFVAGDKLLSVVDFKKGY